MASKVFLKLAKKSTQSKDIGVCFKISLILVLTQMILRSGICLIINEKDFLEDLLIILKKNLIKIKK